MIKLLDFTFLVGMIYAAIKLIQIGGWPDIFMAILLILGALFYLVCSVLWLAGVEIAKRKKKEEATQK